MAFDRQSGGHTFDQDRIACTRCGMTWKDYMDNGKRRCTCHKEPEKLKTGIPIPD